MKSQLAQIDLELGPAKPVKKSVSQPTPTITNGGSELLTEQLLAQRWFCSTSRLQRWRMDEKGPSYLKIGGKALYRLEDVRLYVCHAGSKPQPVHDKYKPFRKSGTATVLPSKSASNPLISLGVFLRVCFSYRLGMETSPF